MCPFKAHAAPAVILTTTGECIYDYQCERPRTSAKAEADGCWYTTKGEDVHDAE